MEYEVVIGFKGEAEITVEADSIEEARSKAESEFSPIDIDEANITYIDVIDPDEDE